MLDLFDVGTGQLLFTTSPALARPHFSPDGRWLAATVQDDKIGIWNVGDGREYRALVRKNMPGNLGGYGTLYDLPSVHPDGRLLAVGMADGFGLWDLASGSELGFISTGVGNVFVGVLFEPTGALLTLCPRGLLRWPIGKRSGGTEQWVMGPPERLPLPRGHHLSRSRDGRVIATCSRAINVEEVYAGGWILRSDRAGEPLRVDAGADLRFIEISPDGQWAVTVSQPTRQAKIWDARDGRFVKQLAESGAGPVHFSPDGKWLSTDADGGCVFAVGTWEVGQRFGAVGTFTPDSRLMAIVARSGKISLVDRTTGRELARLEGTEVDRGGVPVFTPDGTKLIVANTAIRVWDLRLISAGLAELGLDWNLPPYPPADSENESIRRLKLEIHLGDLAKPLLMPDEDARLAIEHCRGSLKKNPDNATTCNNLAWLYLTTPKPFRDVKAALPLAEKAVRLDPDSAEYANTLGLARYRDGRYHQAIEVLRPNLNRQDDQTLAFDLFVLAMSYHQLGETPRARDHYDWAIRWINARGSLSSPYAEELKLFRAEAEEVLRINPK